MVKLMLLIALLPGAAFAAVTPDAVGKGCYPSAPHDVTATGRAPYHRLDQLPPAAEILTVIRSVDGCQKPVVVRYGIGGNRATQEPGR